MAQQTTTQTQHAQHRQQLEAKVLRDFDKEMERGTMTSQAYSNIAVKHGISWWQAYYIIKKSRKAKGE